MNSTKLGLSPVRLNQLKSYAALSTAFLAIYNNANSQVVYNDVNPDLNVFLDDIAIDLDDDGTNDFKLVFLSESFATFAPNELKVRINPLGSNQVAYSFQTLPVTYAGAPYATYIDGATQILFTNIPVINEGIEINADFNFHYDIGGLYEKLFFYIYSSYDIQSFIGGNWNGINDKFAAIKLYSDGALHYGWLRLSVSVESGIVLKDYAFELLPETPIATAINQYSIEWIAAGDYGISGDASDLQFDFNAAADEEDILSYRVVCVKADNEFNVAIANALLPENYLEIIPDGSDNYALAFPSTAYDSDGDLIVVGQAYKLFVLNVMQPAINYENMLSIATDQFTLLDVVEPAVDLSMADISNNGNGSDLRINFDAAITEQGVAEYRIYILQKDAADLFTIEDALLLTPDRYTAVLPTGDNYEIFLAADAIDADGNVIEPNRYKSFVVSIPDGTTINVPAITPVSNVVLLETATAVVSAPILSNIGETGTGSDIKIVFESPALEQTIASYSVFLVDFATAFDFNLEAAQLSENYISITPTGADVAILGSPSLLDSEGNPITWGVPYYAYVLSQPSENGILDTLSPPSNQVILNFPVTINNTSFTEIQPQILVSGNNLEILIAEPNSNAIFKLLDLSGKTLLERTLITAKTTLSIDVPSGAYVVNIVESGKLWAKKIVLSN